MILLCEWIFMVMKVVCMGKFIINFLFYVGLYLFFVFIFVDFLFNGLDFMIMKVFFFMGFFWLICKFLLEIMVILMIFDNFFFMLNLEFSSIFFMVYFLMCGLLNGLEK